MIELEEVHSDISPWKQGDILMNIGSSEKKIVIGGGHYHYGVWKLISVYNMDTHHTEELCKSEADWSCVKVGKYDFENDQEVEDEER